jgi:hypothetical protein
MVVPACAADLNTPLNETPTLGSEIKKGHQAAEDCSRGLPDPEMFVACISAQGSKSEQSTVNPKPFLLGLYFGAWWNTDLLAESAKSLPDNVFAQQRYPQWQNAAQGELTVVRTYQHDLGVTDGQLLEATGRDDPRTKARLTFWSAPPENSLGSLVSMGLGLSLPGVPQQKAIARWVTLLRLQSAGLAVTDVTPRSPAARAGISVGDIILQCNLKPISSISDFESQSADAVLKLKAIPIELWHAGQLSLVWMR